MQVTSQCPVLSSKRMEVEDILSTRLIQAKSQRKKKKKQSESSSLADEVSLEYLQYNITISIFP